MVRSQAPRTAPTNPNAGLEELLRRIRDLELTVGNLRAITNEANGGGTIPGTTDRVYLAPDDPDVVVYESTLPDDGLGIAYIPASTLAQLSPTDIDVIQFPTL